MRTRWLLVASLLLALAEASPVEPGAAPTRREIDIGIREVAAVYQLDPMLLTAVMSVESDFNPRAVSPKGAQGLMQLMPSTAAALGVDRIQNPWENLEGGARYLRDRLDRFGGDLTLALAAYNAGEGAVRRYGGVPPYPETRRYVAEVLARYRALKGTAIAAQAAPAEGPPRPAIATAAAGTTAGGARVATPREPAPSPVVIEIQEVTVDTSETEARNSLGMLALRRGRLDEAAQHFESALVHDPRDARLLNNLGLARYLQGDLRTAAEHFRRAWQRDPARVESGLNLMLVSAQLGRYADAKALLARTKAAGERLPEWHLNAATVLEVEGDRTRAARHYRRFLELTAHERSPLRVRVAERLAVLTGP